MAWNLKHLEYLKYHNPETSDSNRASVDYADGPFNTTFDQEYYKNITPSIWLFHSREKGWNKRFYTAYFFPEK